MSIVIHGHLRRGTLAVDLDLEIPTGLTTLTGPNGVGKTSLLRLIAGLDALDHGTLSINGSTVDDPAARRFVPAHQRPIAMTFQELRLFPHLTSLDNVAFPLRRTGHSRTDARSQARALLERVGAGDISDHHPERLSGGQAQRVALARSLAAQPDVLLLDEPLAAVDAESRDDLRTLLTQPDLAPTVLWVSHDPNDSHLTGSRIVASHDGIGHTQHS
jgi:molybdate transport system ATP-binding protein